VQRPVDDQYVLPQQVRGVVHLAIAQQRRDPTMR
jgi:hypothetical protein